jgi:peptidyl-prolyl cis-trans isomerase B (cyclophilin B)
VPTSKNRQRALARAKVERQIARRAAAARRRRQLQAGLGAGLAVVLVVLGVVWAAGGFSSKKTPPAVAGECAWTPIDPASNPDITDAGKPPETGILHDGTPTMTITTNQGVIEAELNPALASCTVASFIHLAGRQFFNNTKCHRLTTAGIFVLQCGDPKGTGKGGPAYRFPDENLPRPQEPDTDPTATPSAAASASASAEPGIPTDLYPKGTLAMANSGPDTNGSQFFIVYKDGSALKGDYSIFGKVTKGLEIVEKIAAAGVATGGQSATDGPPKTDVVIQSLTVSTAPPPSSTPGSTPASTPSATPAATPSATPQS